jgi:quercetin dioxygenase-like cupin family protein
MSELTLLEQLLEAAQTERERVARGRNHVNRDELEVELNALGYTRWYLHPALEEPSTRALYFFELEIPSGSRSGLLQHQGGVIHFVLEGSGWTEYDDGQHEWEAGDVIALPVKEAGIQFRHHNTGLGPVRMLVTWPNFDSANGPEGGVFMTVLEPSPEWAAKHPASAG